MSIFYSVDRGQSLNTGDILDLATPSCPIKPLAAHTLSIFDNGVSYHANNYFFNYQINLVQSEERFGATIEMLLEERRRNSFPEKPSRFQSLFACESVREAAWFRGFSKYSIDTPIFEIHASAG
ncbi:MAG: hypothetical protein ACMX3H_14655 [Sodalis sp. (in: enterobacteria)]|uniref:hypothetical protein n=1 Tax=Sodalis sp. (in: enterobacteria) TaxID=1898979 RepID=UPI0039E683AA